jgi:hypothetical protein
MTKSQAPMTKQAPILNGLMNETMHIPFGTLVIRVLNLFGHWSLVLGT